MGVTTGGQRPLWIAPLAFSSVAEATDGALLKVIEGHAA
ncbi:MAG: hypothetical protein K0S57_2637 [Ramlibacter sp.]|nr:hypothetical protein [Ramlibacter sp.]